jgi:hypothetical protein
MIVFPLLPVLTPSFPPRGEGEFFFIATVGSKISDDVL